MAKCSFKVTITSHSPSRGQTKRVWDLSKEINKVYAEEGVSKKDYLYTAQDLPKKTRSRISLAKAQLVHKKGSEAPVGGKQIGSTAEVKKYYADHFRQQMTDGFIEQAIPALYGAAMKQRKAQCDYFGAYFQHLVSRTPEDENYTYKVDINGKVVKRHHTKDKDVIKKDWVIEGFSASGDSLGVIKADDIALSGCFDKFGDKSSTAIVSSVMYDRWLKSNGKMLCGVKVKNVNPRFSLLEYGEYEVKNHGENRGPKYQHGTTTDGYSVQAPQGMLRITNAEFEYMRGIKNPAKYAKDAHFSKRITRSQMQKLAKKMQGNKFKFNFKLNSQEVEEFLDGFV